MAIRSGSLGCWPSAPAAYPAKPTPSVSSISTAWAGTSLAHGFPLRSTKVARMKLTSSAFTRSDSVAADGPASASAGAGGLPPSAAATAGDGMPCTVVVI
jgi:hypothetical protein